MSIERPTWNVIDCALSELSTRLARVGCCCDTEDVELILPWRIAERLAGEMGFQLSYDDDGRAWLVALHGIDVSTFKTGRSDLK